MNQGQWSAILGSHEDIRLTFLQNICMYASFSKNFIFSSILVNRKMASFPIKLKFCESTLFTKYKEPHLVKTSAFIHHGNPKKHQLTNAMTLDQGDKLPANSGCFVIQK